MNPTEVRLMFVSTEPTAISLGQRASKSGWLERITLYPNGYPARRGLALPHDKIGVLGRWNSFGSTCKISGNPEAVSPVNHQILRQMRGAGARLLIDPLHQCGFQLTIFGINTDVCYRSLTGSTSDRGGLSRVELIGVLSKHARPLRRARARLPTTPTNTF